MSDGPSVADVLAAAVDGIGGEPRPGQLRMAEAVAAAFADGTHLLVQAATGTGKSLGYLVPALLHRGPVVVATATVALQQQIVARDLPRLVADVEAVLGRRPSYAILKGRSHYVCKHKLYGGLPDDGDGDALFAAARRPRSAATCSGCAGGRTRPTPATATSWCQGCRTGPGGRPA